MSKMINEVFISQPELVFFSKNEHVSESEVVVVVVVVHTPFEQVCPEAHAQSEAHEEQVSPALHCPFPHEEELTQVPLEQVYPVEQEPQFKSVPHPSGHVPHVFPNAEHVVGVHTPPPS
jgi:hypothetical protein